MDLREEGAAYRNRDPAAIVSVLGGTAVLASASVLGMALAFAEKIPCRVNSTWNGFGEYQHACYTDIFPLYSAEGLAAGKVPYSGHAVEYPVLIGGAMQVAAWAARIFNDAIRMREFFDITMIMLAVCAVIGVLATAQAAGPDRRWQALMVALSPALILNAFVNWDLIAMALLALGMAAWARRSGGWAGVFFGLAVATKFYPLVVFGPLFLLCLRAGQLREFWRTTRAAVLAWLVVNVPVMIVAPAGWARFYTMSKDRGADWGSIWFFFDHFNVPLLGTYKLSLLNLLAAVFLLLGFAGVALLALSASRRPRLPQLCFLLLAVFLMSNKVWSPQYVIWLLPLAVLARPRVWPYVAWQIAEVGYFFAIWGYLLFVSRNGAVIPGYNGLGTGWYLLFLLGRFCMVGLLCGFVVRDILVPARDVVRTAGLDDPAGGVLDGAPDKLVLSGLLTRPDAASAS